MPGLLVVARPTASSAGSTGSSAGSGRSRRPRRRPRPGAAAVRGGAPRRARRRPAGSDRVARRRHRGRLPRPRRRVAGRRPCAAGRPPRRGGAVGAPECRRAADHLGGGRAGQWHAAEGACSSRRWRASACSGRLAGRRARGRGARSLERGAGGGPGPGGTSRGRSPPSSGPCLRSSTRSGPADRDRR